VNKCSKLQGKLNPCLARIRSRTEQDLSKFLYDLNRGFRNPFWREEKKSSGPLCLSQLPL